MQGSDATFSKFLYVAEGDRCTTSVRSFDMRNGRLANDLAVVAGALCLPVWCRWAAKQHADTAKEAAGGKHAAPFRPPSPQKRTTSAQGGEFYGTISGYYAYIPVRAIKSPNQCSMHGGASRSFNPCLKRFTVRQSGATRPGFTYVLRIVNMHCYGHSAGESSTSV